MERIKKALERARQEREAALGNNAAQPASAAAAARTAVRSPAEERIEYTQTRVVPVSQAALKRNRVLTGLGPGPIADAYGMLRTRVLHRMRQNGWQALAVTSPGQGEGKTLTAINLAISLAREVNHTVLLVDFDLRRPSIHRYFGYQPPKGLSDYVAGEATVGEILFNPSVERLVVLPNTKPMLNSSEVLSSPTVVQLVEELKSRYPERLVIFDLPPLLSTDDALAFSPYVDAVLMVVEEGGTKRDQLERAVEMLGGNATLLGTVLNKSREAMANDYY